MSVILEEQITLPSAEDIFQRIVDSLSMESQENTYSFSTFAQNYFQSPFDSRFFQMKNEKPSLENNLVYLVPNLDLVSPFRATEMRKMQPFILQSKEGEQLELPLEQISSVKGSLKFDKQTSGKENIKLSTDSKIGKKNNNNNNKGGKWKKSLEVTESQGVPKKRGRPAKYSPYEGLESDELNKWSIFQLRDALRLRGIPVGKGYKHELVQKVRQALDMEKMKANSECVESPIQLDSDSELEIKPQPLESLDFVGNDNFEQTFIHLNDQYSNNMGNLGFVPIDTFLGPVYSAEKSRWIL